MSKAFLGLLNLSPVISVMIIAVIIIRVLFVHAPKRINKILWTIIGVRCLLPFSLSSSIGILPYKTVPYTLSNEGIESTGIALPNIVMPISNYGTVAASGKINIKEAFPYIWLGGLILFLIYMIISYIRVKLLVADAIPCGEKIYSTDRIFSPFVMGIVNPRIYIKTGMNEGEQDLIIAHERCHIKNNDNLLKLISFIILGIYWFNPLVWVAYIYFCKDIEMACDEEVISQLPMNTRKEYALALLESSHRQGAFIYGAGFSENNTKERVKKVMNYKKPKLYVIILAIAVCLVFLTVFFTVGKKQGDSVNAENLVSLENPADTENQENSEISDETDTEEILDENPGFFETEDISIKYNTEKFYGYQDGDIIVLNSMNAVAGTSLIQIIKSEYNTIDDAVNSLKQSSILGLTEGKKIDFNGYNAVSLDQIVPDGDEGVKIDDYYIVAEYNGKVFIIDKMITRDPDEERAKALLEEFSEALSKIKLK